MSTFSKQLKWQFVLLQKNNIVGISFAVTIIYGLVLFFLRNTGNLDKVLVSLVLNDPSVIGYFFIGLAIYIEMKQHILPAIFVSPLRLHQMLISKTLALVIIGVICSLGLALSVKGVHFDILDFAIGTFGICTLSALLGLMMLTYADDFLKFALLSIPLFLAFVNLPLIQYLGALDLGFVKYLLPIQGSLDLLDHSISKTPISHIYAYLSIIILIPIFYVLAYRLFKKRIVEQ